MIEQAQAVKTYLQPLRLEHRRHRLPLVRSGAADRRERPLSAVDHASTRRRPAATGSRPSRTRSTRWASSFGIHIMRGIPRKSLTRKLPIANSTYKATDAGNSDDPCPWDTHNVGRSRRHAPPVRPGTTRSSRSTRPGGIDFVKIDDMLSTARRLSPGRGPTRSAAAIDKTGRSIVLSLSPGPTIRHGCPTRRQPQHERQHVARRQRFLGHNGAQQPRRRVHRRGQPGRGDRDLTPGHWPDATCCRSATSARAASGRVGDQQTRSRTTIRSRSCRCGACCRRR